MILLFLMNFFFLFIFCIGQYELDNLRKDFNRINKEVARLKIVSGLWWTLFSMCLLIFTFNG